MTKKENKFDWPALIIGIIYIVVGFVALRNPDASLVSLVVILAVAAILKGVAEILGRNKLKKETGFSPALPIIIGVIDIIIGIFLLFNIEIGILTVPFIVAIWFIVDSIFDLIKGQALRGFGPVYGVNIISNVLTLIAGIFMIANPLSSYFTVAFLVGFYFIVTGIRYIVIAFAR